MKVTEQWVFVANLGSRLSNEINETIITKLFYQKITVEQTVIYLRQHFKETELKAFIKARRQYDFETYWYLGLSAVVLVVAVIYWGLKGFSGLDLTRIFFSFGLAVVLIVTMLLLVPFLVKEIVRDIKQHHKNWQKYYQVVEIFSHRKN